MNLTFLEIKNLRNIEQINLDPVSKFNFIIGENGSGKTSILEAVFLLSRGKSFRTHLARRFIQYQTDQVNIFANFVDENNQPQRVGIQKSIRGETLIRSNGENLATHLELAEKIPVLLLHIDSFKLLTEGPKERRQFFDYGLFHVKHNFLPCWREYSSILKQRNSALRLGYDISVIKTWDEMLINKGGELNAMREEFIKEYQTFFTAYIARFIRNRELQVRFYRGWNEEMSFSEVLKHNFQRDKEFGYTTQGPHRFDFKVMERNLPVADIFSRGQIKLLICALYFSMFDLVKTHRQKECLFLIDDLSSEFDVANCGKIMGQLQQFQSQIFLTGTSSTPFSDYLSCSENKMFHVEHGRLL
jgi:DNA replication and repair protein RecF